MFKFDMKLPFWMDRGEVKKIVSLFQKWWLVLLEIIKRPFSILDEENCSESLLYLIAYERNIERFKDEPLSLFRKRVKYAFINEKEAGSKQGFINIFKRLDIGYVEIVERFDKENWDVIKIQLSNSQLARNNELIHLIINKYGMTCRRYELDLITHKTIHLCHGEFNNDTKCHVAKFTPNKNK